GPNLAENLAYARKLREELARIPSLRDLQYGQSLAYPTIEVEVDRARAGLSGVTAEQGGRSLAPYTLSSRFTTPLYWRDPKSGVGYQVQLEVLQSPLSSAGQVEQMPVRSTPSPRSPGGRGAGGEGTTLRVEDVARVRRGSMPGEVDRYNMKRM